MSQLRWDQHFLGLCSHHANMSKDPSSIVGAVIVGPDREIVSVGFNGFPRGVEDTEERLTNRDTKLKLMVHAEMNAILAAARTGVRLKDCTIYVSGRPRETGSKIWGGAPCTRCSVEIIQSGIREVVAFPPDHLPDRWKEDCNFAASILREAGVEYREVSRPEGM